MAKRTVISLALMITMFLVAFSGLFGTTGVTHADSYCQVTYTVTNQWAGGFGVNITVQNTSSSAWSSWSLMFAFPASGQTVSQGWNGMFSQSGQNVTVTNMSWNSSVAANASVNPGFNGIWTTSNPVSASFTVNGNACNGSGGGGTTPTPTPTPVSNSSVYAVNAGAAAAGSFAADGYYSGGNTYATTASIDTSAVSNPAPQAVYQTERFGNFTYTFPNLSSGAQYTVRLHFAEIYWTSSGQRLFNASINGQQVLTNFDIYATVGAANKAIVEQYTTTADANGQIAIQFISVKDNAKVNGIEILGSSSVTPTPGSGNCSTGSAPTTSFALGHRTFNYARGTDRPLPTEVWYPRTGTGDTIDNAPIASGTFPLILFSHGLGGNPPSYSAQILPMAQAGFIVAAPWYPNTKSGSSGNIGDVPNQGLDASYVITQVLALNTTPGDLFNGHIRTTCGVGAEGHSAGAATTETLLTIHRDPRVTAAVELASFSEGGSPVDPPAKVLQVHGTNDPLTSYSGAMDMYNAYPATWPKAFLTVTGGTHDDYVLLSGPCAPTCGRGYATALATDIDWMRYALYGDLAARNRLPSDAASSITSFIESGV